MNTLIKIIIFILILTLLFMILSRMRNTGGYSKTIIEMAPLFGTPEDDVKILREYLESIPNNRLKYCRKVHETEFENDDTREFIQSICERSPDDLRPNMVTDTAKNYDRGNINEDRLLFKRLLNRPGINKTNVTFNGETIQDNGKSDNYIVIDYSDKRIIDMFVFTIQSCNNCSFIYTRNTDNEETIYLMPQGNIENLFEMKDESDRIEGDESRQIIVINKNGETRQYCMELAVKDSEYVYISFITTGPDGCADFDPGKLNGLFKTLDLLLTEMKYNSAIYLEDDVQAKVGNEYKRITKERLINRRGSIYEKYGFVIEEPARSDIINDLTYLRMKQNSQYSETLYHNIPMIALNRTYFSKPLSSENLVPL